MTNRIISFEEKKAEASNKNFTLTPLQEMEIEMAQERFEELEARERADKIRIQNGLEPKVTAEEIIDVGIQLQRAGRNLKPIREAAYERQKERIRAKVLAGEYEEDPEDEEYWDLMEKAEEQKKWR